MQPYWVAPARERGLKLYLALSIRMINRVAPARERGLKFRTRNGVSMYNGRSREGAWIEIL